MQKIGLKQTQTTKLSPQQIQFIKLLQIPAAELAIRVEEELESNPALEDGRDLEEDQNNEYDDLVGEDKDPDTQEEDKIDREDEINIDDYINQDEIAGYKMQGDGFDPNHEERENQFATTNTMIDSLHDQLGMLNLTDHQVMLGRQIIGSLEPDGYLRREPDAIVNDLAFMQNIMATTEDVEEMIKVVQSFEPAGVGAPNLKTCLLLQLHRKSQSPIIRLAIKMLEQTYEEFLKKHYDKIQRKLGIEEDELKSALDVIIKLNPKPGSSAEAARAARTIIPDYTLKNENGQINVLLNNRNAPELHISRSFSELLDTYSKSNKKDKKMKETVGFVKQKLDAARWFIDAIQQRQQTLLKTMNAIVRHQYDYFLEGDESLLKPMILKDIAETIEMDISTVSRVVSSKYVQTEYGIFPLKYFFSEGISTESGTDASSREVKNKIQNLIEKENKSKPLSDEKIGKLLKEDGYNIARRTVAKYREQLEIPVARLRKKL